MHRVANERSWVLSTAMVITPIVLVIVALWLWPLMRNVYSMPDSAVGTYGKALHAVVPPGSGRITRTAVIERVIACELGDLSDFSARRRHHHAAQWRAVLEHNAQLGRWAAAVMAFPQKQRVAMFNWGLRNDRLRVVNQAFSGCSENRIAALHALAKMPGRFADAIIERLLHDRVFVVRFSVLAELLNRKPTAPEMDVLRHWAAGNIPAGLEKNRRWKMFLFGRLAVNAKPVLYRMDVQRDLTYTRRCAALLLARWTATRLPTTSAGKKNAALRKAISATSQPAAAGAGNSEAEAAELQRRRRDLSQAIAHWTNPHATGKTVKAALTAEYKTLVAVESTMPWQRQLSHIMAFNAAMSRWISLISQLPPTQSRAMFNWARFRTQDVELMRLAMSQKRARRLSAVRIAPKLRGVERVWLVRHLLMDNSVTVELSMLRELWAMPPSPGLKKLLIHWTNFDPLPTGHQPLRIAFGGTTYVLDRTVSAGRFRQARQIGAMLVRRWNK